jgi:hypothetical protein
MMLIEQVAKNLGCPCPETIDSLDKEVKENEGKAIKRKLSQAAIPAVLVAAYTLSRTDEGCIRMVKPDPNADWLQIFYDGKEEDAVEKVAKYACVTPGEANALMEKVSEQTVKILKSIGEKEAACVNIKAYMNEQRDDILSRLPSELEITHLLALDPLIENDKV